jgi:hypothetical protein
MVIVETASTELRVLPQAPSSVREADLTYIAHASDTPNVFESASTACARFSVKHCDCVALAPRRSSRSCAIGPPRVVSKLKGTTEADQRRCAGPTGWSDEPRPVEQRGREAIAIAFVSLEQLSEESMKARIE